MRESLPAWRTLLNWALLLVVVAVVVPFVIYAVPQTVGADQSYVVLSGSMEPAISPGDVVVVNGVAPESITAGDVVTFRTSASEPPTTHRVVEVVDSGGEAAFRTKGDANEDPDQALVRPSQLVGRVLLVVPFVGHVVQFVNTPTGFAALVVVPLALFVVSEFWSLFAGGLDSDTGSGTGAAASDERLGESDRTAAANEAPAWSSGWLRGRVSSPFQNWPRRAGSATDESPAGHGAAAGATHGEQPLSEEPPDPDPDSESITLTTRELRLGVLLLALVTPYSVWTAVQEQSALTISIAVASSLFLVFFAGAYRSSLAATDPSTQGETSAASTAAAPDTATPEADALANGAAEPSPGATREGNASNGAAAAEEPLAGLTADDGAASTPRAVVPIRLPEPGDREAVRAASVEALIERALASGDWLFVDDQHYLVVRDDVVYYHPVGERPENRPGDADDSRAATADGFDASNESVPDSPTATRPGEVDR